MSTQLVQDEINALRGGAVQGFFVYAAAAATVYEYVITFAEEIFLIWTRSITLSNAIFLLNRYVLLLLAVSEILNPLSWYTALSCEATNMFIEAVMITMSIIVAGFSALRVYAIANDGFKAISAVVVLSLGLAPVAVELFLCIRISYYFVVRLGYYPLCDYNAHFSSSVNTALLLLARMCTTVADLIVLLCTWARTYRIAKESRKSNVGSSLAMLLLRDGTLYITVLLAFSVLEIILLKSSGRQSIFAGNYINAFSIPLSSILINRFLLNLRQASNKAAGLGAHSNAITLHLQSTQSSSRIVGNMGEHLEYNSDLRFADMLEEDNVEDTEDRNGWDASEEI
ncbi:uncharacterized protein LAESUDRAFT_810983 [Laetiporus sulphureus 93-53]|uniref:DUF6533 domain-containing protein n=1 Tax=Laetiporus sulphureus 93-53 TaxID=1314785 RepID=A0A165FTI9_9APHY|nr:uncharacterized protein LAESUDRAFT_810983 [Laetiporus sulphureus 93-53]KZT09391.1 hypothetical protein LAESUDRAFT_810983 [Laetiporus sulphureus 93-53]